MYGSIDYILNVVSEMDTFVFMAFGKASCFVARFQIYLIKFKTNSAGVGLLPDSKFNETNRRFIYRSKFLLDLINLQQFLTIPFRIE